MIDDLINDPNVQEFLSVLTERINNNRQGYELRPYDLDIIGYGKQSKNLLRALSEELIKDTLNINSINVWLRPFESTLEDQAHIFRDRIDEEEKIFRNDMNKIVHNSAEGQRKFDEITGKTSFKRINRLDSLSEITDRSRYDKDNEHLLINLTNYNLKDFF